MPYYETLKKKIIEKETSRQTIDVQFDNELLKIDHYKIHPEMLPYIGVNYSQTEILLVGESHYLGDNEPTKDESSKYQKILCNAQKKKEICEKWYQEEWNNIIDDDIETIKNSANYYYTRRVIIDTFIDGKVIGSGQIFYNPLKAIWGETTSKENINKFSFMNYFQRPEFNGGDTIKNEEKDNEVASKTLFAVIGIIKPKMVIFLSSKAYKAFKRTQLFKSVDEKIIIDYVSHPGCLWWNRDEGKYGKNKFKALFYKHEDIKGEKP